MSRKISMKMAKRIAEYYVQDNHTVRKTALYFGMSKSTVHKILVDFQENRGTRNTELARKVREQIMKNTDERAIRGGNATKEKYLGKKKE